MNPLARVVGLLIGLFAVGDRPARAAVVWEEGTYTEALERARSSGRWLLVDIYARWCGPCHEMDEKVYAREEVGRALGASFVMLRRDGEVGEGEALYRRFHGVGYPTLFIVDPNSGPSGIPVAGQKTPRKPQGAEVDRLMGFVEAKVLLETVARYREDRGTLADLERRLASSPGDEALRLAVGRRHAMRGDLRAVTELNAVAAADPQDRGKRGAAALLMLGKYYYLRGAKDYPHAEATLLDLQRRFPTSEEAAEVPYNLAIAQHATGRDSDARATLDKWIETAPPQDRGERYNGYAWLCYKNEFDRPRGVEVARHGLELNPKDHALWDTLGELYAATGKTAEARAAEAHALELKPGDAYYIAQIKRFGGTQ